MVGDKAWKRAERQIARLLGGRRVPVTGRGRGDAPDIDHPTLSVEVKTRTTTPAWLSDALQQARASSRHGRTPVAVIHTSGRAYKDALCVLRLQDLAALTRSNPAGESYHTEGQAPYLTEGPKSPQNPAKFNGTESSGR